MTSSGADFFFLTHQHATVLLPTPIVCKWCDARHLNCDAASKHTRGAKRAVWEAFVNMELISRKALKNNPTPATVEIEQHLKECTCASCEERTWRTRNVVRQCHAPEDGTATGKGRSAGASHSFDWSCNKARQTFIICHRDEALTKTKSRCASGETQVKLWNKLCM